MATTAKQAKPIKDMTPQDNILFMFQDKDQAETVLEIIQENDTTSVQWSLYYEGEEGSYEYYIMNNMNQVLGIIKY